MLVLPLFAIVANWARLEIVRAVNEASGPTRVDLYSVPQVVMFREVGLGGAFNNYVDRILPFISVSILMAILDP